MFEIEAVRAEVNVAPINQGVETTASVFHFEFPSIRVQSFFRRFRQARAETTRLRNSISRLHSEKDAEKESLNLRLDAERHEKMILASEAAEAGVKARRIQAARVKAEAATVRAKDEKSKAEDAARRVQAKLNGQRRLNRFLIGLLFLASLDIVDNHTNHSVSTTLLHAEAYLVSTLADAPPLNSRSSPGGQF